MTQLLRDDESYSHKAYFREYHKKRNRVRRHAARVLLGGKCKRCEFADERALCFDHLNGNPKQETTYQVVEKILNGRDSEYQLLCGNCNMIRKHEEQQHAGYFKRLAGAL